MGFSRGQGGRVPDGIRGKVKAQGLWLLPGSSLGSGFIPDWNWDLSELGNGAVLKPRVNVGFSGARVVVLTLGQGSWKNEDPEPLIPAGIDPELWALD